MSGSKNLAAAAVAALLTAACSAASTRPQAPSAVPHVPLVLERIGSFEAGGQIRTDGTGKSLSCDHGHVEYMIPHDARATPLFLWHSSSAAVWQRRWDGGEGFQAKMLRHGYATYVWDGPRVGRANWGCEDYPYTAQAGRDQASYLAWRIGPADGQYFPGVQFPIDDPAALDQAVRARYQEFDSVPSAQLEAAAAVVALEKIGPSVLVTNSAGGFRALLTALKSDNIRGIVAYENPGFVFPRSANIDVPEGPFGPVYVSDEEFARLTRIPMQFVWGDNLNRSAVWAPLVVLNREFVKLVNMRGGKAEIVMLPDVGLRGNTHIPFADLNNEAVAQQLFSWMEQHQLVK